MVLSDTKMKAVLSAIARSISRSQVNSTTPIAACNVSIKYNERLAEAGLVPPNGSVGDSYDNALAETINGLYKAELIHRRGPWRTLAAVEYDMLEWGDWFNNSWSRSANVPPAEADCACYASLEKPAKLAT